MPIDGRICKSAPTVCVNFMDEWIMRARMTRLGGLHDLMAQAVLFVQNGTLGRAC